MNEKWRGGDGGIIPTWRITWEWKGAPGGEWWVTFAVIWFRTKLEMEIGR